MPAAARFGDFHVCPASTGPVPHIGGPIVMGAFNVPIEGMAAARMGDMAVCIGPPDMVAMGCFTVFISGSPAARLGDMTAHGGIIVAGAGTVYIGNGG